MTASAELKAHPFFCDFRIYEFFGVPAKWLEVNIKKYGLHFALWLFLLYPGIKGFPMLL